MSIAVLVLLAVTAAGGLILTARGERVRPYWAGAILAALLAVAAVVAWAADTPADGLLEGVTVAAVLAAVLGGGPVATAVLGAADPSAVGVAGGPQDPSILRGGGWIGGLERAAVAATLWQARRRGSPSSWPSRAWGVSLSCGRRQRRS